jgi:hypothetical protein
MIKKKRKKEDHSSIMMKANIVGIIKHTILKNKEKKRVVRTNQPEF